VSQTTTGVRAILSVPAIYQLWAILVGGERWHRTLAREHVVPVAGERVLDVGCGPADLLRHLGDVEYVGLDLSQRYVANARARFDGRGEFRVGDATAIDPDLHGFDAVVAFGVLHHIDDDGVRRLFAGAAGALKPEGRMVTVDPVFALGQNRVARATIARDRGQHVRTEEAYAALASTAFGSVRTVIRTDMLRIPYTHCIMECRAPST
jgi:SAM-dependent methyltransferase